MDKAGKEIVLPVTSRTGVRITKNDSSRVSFYFDTLLLQDSSVTGSKTHFFKAPVKRVYLHEIRKIEIMK